MIEALQILRNLKKERQKLNAPPQSDIKHTFQDTVKAIQHINKKSRVKDIIAVIYFPDS